MPEKKSQGFCVYKHGMSNTRFYKIWSGIIKRCCNENSIAFKDYGGRGIKICDEWREDFINFKNDMYDSYLQHVEKYGEKNTTIERINVNGNYEKNNCGWATRTEQNNNNRRVQKYPYKGSLLTLAEICRLENKKYELIYNRIRRGWEFEKALNTDKLAHGVYERTEWHREKARESMYANSRSIRKSNEV